MSERGDFKGLGCVPSLTRYAEGYNNSLRNLLSRDCMWVLRVVSPEASMYTIMLFIKSGKNN